jgi:hypothetical protein
MTHPQRAPLSREIAWFVDAIQGTLLGVGARGVASRRQPLFLFFGLTTAPDVLPSSVPNRWAHQEKQFLRAFCLAPDPVVRPLGHDLTRPKLSFFGIPRQENQNDLETAAPEWMMPWANDSSAWQRAPSAGPFFTTPGSPFRAEPFHGR